MQNFVIDKEFQELLPPLSEDTYRDLEENIIANGCMYPLVTWKYTLIDGHNRYAICQEHGIPFTTIEKEFDSREDVIEWIIKNQVDRRNLTPMQLTYYRGLHYNIIKNRPGNKSGNNQHSEEFGKNYQIPQSFANSEDLSKRYKVSPKTIRNDEKTYTAIEAIGKASPEARAKILSGAVAIDRKELKRLSSAPEDEIKTVAGEIENGTYEKVRIYTPSGGNFANLNIVGISTSATDKPKNPKVVSGVTGSEYKALLNAAYSGTATQAKKALRVYIDILEDLYTDI